MGWGETGVGHEYLAASYWQQQQDGDGGKNALTQLLTDYMRTLENNESTAIAERQRERGVTAGWMISSYYCLLIKQNWILLQRWLLF
jgi:hypothetical protein